MSDEKAHEIDVGTVHAWGLELTSRYAKAGEMAQMLNFAVLCHEFGVIQSVQSVFYDSKAGLCTVEVKPEVEEGSQTAEAIHVAAEGQLSQFQLFGRVYNDIDG